MNIVKLTGLFTALVLTAGVFTYRASAEETGAPAVMNGSYLQFFTEETGSYADTACPIVQASDLPESYDLRDEGCVTPIKNQGAEGMCHAFAAIGACESNLLKQGLETDCENLDLSEAQLGYFLYTLQEDPLDPLYGDYIDTAGKGADGGNGILAAAGLASGIGTEYEQFCSYDDWNDGYSSYSRYAGQYRLRSLDILERAQTSDAKNTVKSWLMESGAVGFAFYSQRSLYYDNGTSYAYYAENKSFYEDANHAALIVGWDDNYSADNFPEDSRPSNDGAWLVKNSYGVDLFDDGYFWISYEDPSTGSFCRYIMESADSWDDVYEYDGAGYINAYDFDAVANVFTAEYDCVLTALSFNSPTANPSGTRYTIEIYALEENTDDPTDGELIAEVSGTVERSGYITVDTEEEIQLLQGQQFSLVLTMSAPPRSSQKIYLPIEEGASLTSTFSIKYGAGRGESYAYTEGIWEDTSQCSGEYGDFGSIPLKAFAVRTEEYVQLKLQAALLEAESSGIESELLDNALSQGTAFLENGASAAACRQAADTIFAVLEKEGADVSYPDHLYADYGRMAGDSDGDGKLTLDDAADVLSVYGKRGASYICRLTMAEESAMDYVSDGTIGLDDAAGILTRYAEIGVGL